MINWQYETSFQLKLKYRLPICLNHQAAKNVSNNTLFRDILRQYFGKIYENVLRLHYQVATNFSIIILLSIRSNHGLDL